MDYKILLQKIDSRSIAESLNSRIGWNKVAIIENNLKFSYEPIDTKLEIVLECKNIENELEIEITLRFIEGKNDFLKINSDFQWTFKHNIVEGTNHVSLPFMFNCFKKPNSIEKFRMGIKIPQIQELIRVISLEL